MAASAVRGINQFRENARRWRAALKREKQRRAAVFAVHARSPPPPRPLRRFFEIGRGGRGGGNTVHTSTSFEREYFEYFVAKNRLLSLMLLGCWGERGCFFEGKIVSMNCFESTVIISWYSSVTRCRIIYYCTWKFWLEPYKISVTGRKGTKCPFRARQRYCFIGDVRTNKKKRRKKTEKARVWGQRANRNDCTSGDPYPGHGVSKSVLISGWISTVKSRGRNVVSVGKIFSEQSAPFYNGWIICVFWIVASTNGRETLLACVSCVRACVRACCATVYKRDPLGRAFKSGAERLSAWRVMKFN